MTGDTSTRYSAVEFRWATLPKALCNWLGGRESEAGSELWTSVKFVLEFPVHVELAVVLVVKAVVLTAISGV